MMAAGGRQLLLWALAANVLSCGFSPVASQATMFEDQDLAGVWVLPMAQSLEVNCGTPQFAEFDNGLSSLTVAGGQLRVFRLDSFVGLLTQILAPPGFGLNMVNLSPTLEDQASSWTWFQFPPLPSLGRRRLRDQKSPRWPPRAAPTGPPAGGEADTDLSGHSAYEGQDKPSGTGEHEPDAVEVGCSSGGSGPADVSSASSVTFFEDWGSRWGDWGTRGQINNFCDQYSGGLDLAYQASAMLICGSSVTGYDDQGGVLFSVYAQEGFCLDINMDELTEDRMVTFEYTPSSELSHAAPYETFASPNGTLPAGAPARSQFDLGGTSTLFLAPGYELCSAPYSPTALPEDPSAGVDITDQLVESAYVAADIGFQFPFYQGPYSTVYIGRDGILSFGGAEPDLLTAGAPSASQFPAVYALFTDLSSNYQPSEVTARSACVAAKPGVAVKPAGPDSDWTGKYSGLDNCFAKCQLAEGYTAIDYNEETGTCYCWQGDEGQDFQLQAYYAGLSYLIGSCKASVSYRQLPDRFVITYSNLALAGSSFGNSLQVALLDDGSVRITYLSVDVPEGEQVTVGLSSGAAATDSEVDISSSAECGLCGFGIKCPNKSNF